MCAAQVVAGWLGISEPAWRPRHPAHPAPAPPRPRPTGGRRLLASTRMALQMGVALGLAFVVGRAAFGTHWTWAVLTAFIVCSGARGRGDVAHKGVLRAGGAALGTVVATWIAGAFGPGDASAVPLLFAALAVATWLRSTSYAYWAGCVTAVLSLLYGYFGEAAPTLLRTRLEAILVGAALGIIASWLVLPVRTTDVVRRRVADAMAALHDFLGALGTDQAGGLGAIDRHRIAFDRSVEQLGQIARPLELHRSLLRRLGPRPHHADAIDAVRRCAEPVHTIAERAGNAGGMAGEPEFAGLRAALSANVLAIRRAIGRQPTTGCRQVPIRAAATPDAEPAGADVGMIAAIAEIDAALSVLARVFRPALPT